MPNSAGELRDGYEMEFEFIHTGMRQDQRERQGFLGFTLAANGLILGLLMRTTPERTAKQVWFLVVLAAIVTLVAERLTIRASQGVATAGSYIRTFIEPHFNGLKYQRRNRNFKMKGNVSSSHGFAFAYLLVTVGVLSTWFLVPPPDKGGHTWPETGGHRGVRPRQRLSGHQAVLVGPPRVGQDRRCVADGLRRRAAEARARRARLGWLGECGEVVVCAAAQR
jgi:hypothetical protein